MKLFFNTKLYVAMMVMIALISCETDEITRIQFDKAEMSIQVGLSDSLTATVSYAGELSQYPHEWKVADPTILSITEKASNETGNASSFEKALIIKGLKSGNTTVSLIIGGKTLACEVSVQQRSFIFNQAYAENWGDIYETGTNNFDMYLLEKTLSFNSEGKVQGNGHLLYLDFYVPLTQNTLAPGNFILSDEGEINTFYPGEFYESDGETYVMGTILITINGDKSTTSLIKDGEFSIVRDGENFIVSGEFTKDDDEVIQFRYANGIFEESDAREEPVEIKPNFNKGLMFYAGDAYGAKDKGFDPTNNYTLYLGSETINFEDSVLVGELLMLEFNTTLIAKDYIPNGRYNMMTDLTYEKLIPFSLVFGYTTEKGDNFGSWYYGETDKKFKTGYFVSQKTGNNYTIDYELYDRHGSKVWGKFNGPIEYIDATRSAAPVYIKGNKSKTAPAKKTLEATKLPQKKPLRY